jgi:hypothetical protein
MPDEKVGKSRPPKAHQFKPGQSGNRKGRPKGSRNRNCVILKVLGEVVTADLGGQKRRISVTEASLRRLSQMALKGDRQSIAAILQLWKESEDALAAQQEAQYPLSEADRQVIEDIYARMRAAQGDRP